SESNGDPVQGKITRVVMYSGLKHVHHALSTEDFGSKVETKTQGKTRLKRFDTLVQQLEDLLESGERGDRADKAILLSQSLRIEIKLMGHSLTDKEQWLIPNPNRPQNDEAR